MPELDPDGRGVMAEDVEVFSPGLHGTVDVFRAVTPGMRSADGSTPVFAEALAQVEMDEMRTVVVSQQSLARDALVDGRTRSTTRGEPGLTISVPGPGDGRGQVVLAVDETGASQWVFPDNIAPHETLMRANEHRSYTIPLEPAPVVGVTQDRGLLGTIGQKILKVLAFPLVRMAAGVISELFATHWEQTHHRPRLRAFNVDDYQRPDVPDLVGSDLERLSEGPALLFVHGTMSLSHSGFWRIPAPVVARLHQRYGGRVFAFDHPSISVTPTANAQWLGQALQGHALTLDIVAHSRGGLVSRVIAERPDDVGISSADVSVRQLVMVGTPSLGTALADTGQLGQLVDRVTNLLNLVPDNAVTDTIATVLSVVKQLAVGALGGLEGITVMAPGSTWLSELNQARPVTATYHAISSNYEPPAGSPFARIARNAATDYVFGETSNDLIVPDVGVFAANGASAFPIASRLEFSASDRVDHSSYWTSPEVATAFDQWLVARPTGH
jgi:pimeloyl-ACP methyl ester carboxylesterase